MPKDRDESVLHEPKWARRPASVQSGAMASILRIESGRATELVVVSPQVTGVWTHFVDGRTVPCTGDRDSCLIDHRQTTSRWQGWLAVQRWNGHRYFWVVLTEAAVRDCPALVAEDANLRGLQLVVGRSGPGRQSRVWATLGVGICDARRLFAAPDGRVFLRNLWGDLSLYRKEGRREEATVDPRCDPMFQRGRLTPTTR